MLQQDNHVSATLSNDPILVFITTVSEHNVEVFNTLRVGTVRAFTSECLLDNRRLPFLDSKDPTLYRVRGLNVNIVGQRRSINKFRTPTMKWVT